MRRFRKVNFGTIPFTVLSLATINTPQLSVSTYLSNYVIEALLPCGGLLLQHTVRWSPPSILSAMSVKYYTE